MESDYLTMESEEVRELLAMIDRAEETLQLADQNYRPPVGSENNLTGSEVCDLLHISPRTLQTLRDTRQIPFVAILPKLREEHPRITRRVFKAVFDSKASRLFALLD